ncbi:uncharacterized protein J3R85_002687 [Psidium guajava]|nr:uncharacterized protein J3R85_002687 [Psidium guajava]
MHLTRFIAPDRISNKFKQMATWTLKLGHSLKIQDMATCPKADKDTSWSLRGYLNCFLVTPAYSESSTAKTGN